jgi:hypothetical protein
MRIMEPAAFIMTRRMLLGLKQRAETLRVGVSARAGDTRGNRGAASNVLLVSAIVSTSVRVENSLLKD